MDVSNLVEEQILIEFQEKSDKFIFSMVQPFCEEVIKSKISKDDLKQALMLWEKSKQEQGKWIPIKTRPTTDDEKKLYGKTCLWIYDCPLPNDGQAVLITTSTGYVTMTDFDADLFIFEDYEGIDDVVAWMPVPKRYEVEHEKL